MKAWLHQNTWLILSLATSLLVRVGQAQTPEPYFVAVEYAIVGSACEPLPSGKLRCAQSDRAFAPTLEVDPSLVEAEGPKKMHSSLTDLEEARLREEAIRFSKTGDLTLAFSRNAWHVENELSVLVLLPLEIAGKDLEGLVPFEGVVAPLASPGMSPKSLPPNASIRGPAVGPSSGGLFRHLGARAWVLLSLVMIDGSSRPTLAARLENLDAVLSRTGRLVSVKGFLTMDGSTFMPIRAEEDAFDYYERVKKLEHDIERRTNTRALKRAIEAANQDIEASRDGCEKGAHVARQQCLIKANTLELERMEVLDSLAHCNEVRDQFDLGCRLDPSLQDCTQGETFCGRCAKVLFKELEEVFKTSLNMGEVCTQGRLACESL